MPDIQQNRYEWLMRYEYGATVNVPSKKGFSRRLKPFFHAEISAGLPFRAGVRSAQDRGAMVAF